MMTSSKHLCRWGGLAVLVLGTAAAASAGGAESYNATASLETAGGTKVTSPVVISISRWSTDAERDKARVALKSGGTTAVQKELAGMPDVGTIQVGEIKTPIRFARALPVGEGKVITLITSQTIVAIGGGMRGATAADKVGYDVAVAIFQVDGAGKGDAGDLAPAAKVKFDDKGAFVVEDYAGEAVRLVGISKK